MWALKGKKKEGKKKEFYLSLILEKNLRMILNQNLNVYENFKGDKNGFKIKNTVKLPKIYDHIVGQKHER